MFSVLRRKHRRATARERAGPARTAAGRRLYAVGDIHGRFDLLSELLRKIRRDSESMPDARHKLIFLGDYVDRGGQSRAVLELLAGEPPAGFETICLAGNHEDMMLRFLEDGEGGPVWLSNGAVPTIQSYGVQASHFLREADDFIALQSALRDAVPPRHVAFLRGLATHHEDGDYLFVHAGIRPGVPLERQSRDDLIWIRDRFLDSRADHGHTVVHGHSIRPQPELLPNRIGIDTGAYASGVLTCLVLEDDSRRLIQT